MFPKESVQKVNHLGEGEGRVVMGRKEQNLKQLRMLDMVSNTTALRSISSSENQSATHFWP